MNVLVAFLFGTFIIGGMSSGRRVNRRPVLLFALCVVVGAGFYSLRVAQ
jgi:hypothetical protein